MPFDAHRMPASYFNFCSRHFSQWHIGICATLLLIGLTLANIAQAEDAAYNDEDHFMIGLEGRYFSGMYFGQDGYLEAEPFFDIRYGDLFAEGQTFGWDIAKGERASFAIAVTRGNHFLDPDDINDEQKELYLGIEERKRAFEAGFVYKYKSRVGLVSFTYFQDISGASGAQRGGFRIARPIPNEGGIAFTPSLFVNYYRAKFNRYYYEVSREDNDRGILERYGVITDTTRANFEALRQEYMPGNSGHFGFDVDMRMPLAENLILTGYFAYEEVTGPQFRSPLVEDRKQYTSRLGLAYFF